jgi:hypothetical protein
MPKAEHANSTTRRSKLTGLLAGATAAEIAASPAVGGAGADAELIRLCEQFCAAAEELAAIDSGESGATDDDVEEVCRLHYRLIEDIAERAAETPAGLRAKAAAVEQYLRRWADEREWTDGGRAATAAISVLRDLGVPA